MNIVSLDSRRLDDALTPRELLHGALGRVCQEIRDTSACTPDLEMLADMRRLLSEAESAVEALERR